MKAEHQEQIRNAKVPGWFKCFLFEASEGRRSSGAHAMRTGYADVGEALGAHIHRVLGREKITQIERCSGYLDGWTCENLNRFYALIPSRKRKIFIEGFRRGLVRCGYFHPIIRVVSEKEWPSPPKLWTKIVQAEERPGPPRYLKVQDVTPNSGDV